MTKKYGYIYETQDILNDMLYVGMHSESAFDKSYLGGGTRLARAIKRYGKQFFICKPLLFVRTVEELNFWERKFIQEYRLRYGSHKLYNLDAGGFHSGLAGQKRSAETTEKIRNAQIGSKRSKATRKLMSESAKAYLKANPRPPRSQERKDKHSRAMVLWHKNNPEVTKLILARMHEAIRGVPKTLAHRANMSLGKLRKREAHLV